MAVAANREPGGPVAGRGDPRVGVGPSFLPTDRSLPKRTTGSSTTAAAASMRWERLHSPPPDASRTYRTIPSRSCTPMYRHRSTIARSLTIIPVRKEISCYNSQARARDGHAARCITTYTIFYMSTETTTSRKHTNIVVIVFVRRILPLRVWHGDTAVAVPTINAIIYYYCHYYFTITATTLQTLNILTNNFN